MYDFLVEISHSIFKNGLTLSALGTALYVLLRQRKVKKRIAKHLPWLLEDDSETKHYIANQQRIEAKLDALSAHMGVQPCGVLEIGITGPMSLKRPSRSLQAVKYLVDLLRRKKMKNYLRKLGSRKFQAFLAVTIPNIIIMFGFILGEIDLEGQVNEWMPAINLVIQAIVTAVYQGVEGKVDAANAKTKEEMSNPGEAYH